MKYRYLIFLLPWLATITGCASAPVNPDCIPLGRDGSLCLLAPEALPHVQATHIVDIHHHGHQDTFLGQLQINAQTLRLAGTSLFGTSLFMIVYDGHSIISQSLHIDIRPQLLLVMLELSVADPDALKSRLHNLSLEVSTDDNGQVRELFEHGRLLARISKSNAPLDKAKIEIQIPPDDLTMLMTPVASSVPQT